MKSLGIKSLTVAVSVILGLLIVSLMYLWWEKSTLNEASEELLIVQKDVVQYEDIKNNSSLQESKHESELLLSHPALTRHEKHAGGYTMEFNHLSSDEFDRLSNIILNSKMVLKKLTLRKEADSKGSIVVEFEL